MKVENGANLNRRELLTKTAPACAMACLGFTKVPGVLAAATEVGDQEVHKWDVTEDVEMSARMTTQMQFSKLFDFIRNVRPEIGDEALIRLLKIHSAAVGRQLGERLAQRSPDTEFQTYVAIFRPPRYAIRLTHDVVEDTETVFEMRVTECIWASVFRDAGMGGEIGHAAFCNMDYYWPPAFNPNFKMERTKTLMQGHDICNHRYIDTT